VTRHHNICKIISFCVAFSLFLSLFLSPQTVKADSQKGYINASEVHIRSAATTASLSLNKLSFVYVDILEQVEGQNATGWGTVWYKVKYNDFEGFVYGEFIEIVEEPNADFETQLLSFPESYRNDLRQLKALHPNWSFKADILPFSFLHAVEKENVFPLKLVPAGYASSYKSMGYKAYDWEEKAWHKNAGEWQAASTEVIAYYMDPRNFLNQNYVYMFAQQSFDPLAQTEDGLKKVVEGTFLEKGYTDENDTEYGGSYIKVIMEAAKQSGMSPYVIASLIIIEQGSSGNSTLILGTNPTYPGYYNFFNYGASGNTKEEVVRNGFEKAVKLGWNTRSKAIIDGAKHSSGNYITNKQDTYYYMDFNVKFAPYFEHQYAQSVMDALNKGSKLRRYYSENPNAALTFLIPVFKDMPQNAAPKVEASDKLNNYYFTSLSVNGFSMYTEKYTLSINGDTTLTYTVPDGAQYAGNTTLPLKAGSNTVTLPVKAQTGYTNDYTLTINAEKDCVLTVLQEGSEQNPPDNPDDTTTPPVPSIMCGDTNGDGKISIVDLANVQKHLLSIITLEGDFLTASDTNKDGKISIVDLANVQKHLLGLITLN